MIHEVVVTNSNGESLPLTLMRPETSGFIILNIDGLGPAKSNINMRENASVSGSTFNSTITPSRNIVLSLRFLDDPRFSDGKIPAIEAARLRTYKYFPSEGKVRLDVVTDSGKFYIYGYIESNEPSIFSKEQGCTISIICPDPFFRTTDGIISGNIESVSNLFSFPFSNENLVSKNIKFGERFFQSINFPIELEGSISVGPTLILKAVGGPVVNPRIYFYAENDPLVVECLKFAFTTSLPRLEDGDFLEIVCEKQNKSVTRHNDFNNTYLNYIGAVTIDSAWPVLRPGINLFSYEADSGGAYIRFSYEYASLHTGV